MPNLGVHPRKIKTMKPDEMWQTPPNGMVKFNMDGFLRGNLVKMDIGDALKGDEGKLLIQFSIYVGVLDANTIEILVIKQVFQIAVALRWGNIDKVIVESDLENDVKWAIEPTTVPWDIWEVMMNMEFFKIQLNILCFMKVPRFENELADSLVKARMQRKEELLWVINEEEEKAWPLLEEL